jgi:phosphoglycerate dehydrogenase-like enzyme
MRKIVVEASSIAEEALAMMRQVAEITIIHDDATLRTEIHDADAIIISPGPYIDRGVIESAPKLKHIARLGVGFDRIDLTAAKEHRIIVTNTPGITADAVAEFTMALLLSLAKSIPQCYRAVRENKWDETFGLVRANVELRGKTHGIVGLGKIGSRVAVRCRGFGMRVIYFDMIRNSELETSIPVEYVPFNTLLRESDNISLHIPLTKETTNLLDKPQFDSMKKTVLLINQSRAEMVNEMVLIQALREGRIGGYATDVYEKEPPDPESVRKLLMFKNVVATPHMGGGTRESNLRSSLAVAEDVISVIRVGMPKNIMNQVTSVSEHPW